MDYSTTFFAHLFLFLFACLLLINFFANVIQVIPSPFPLHNLLRLIIPSSTSSLVDQREESSTSVILPEDLIFNEILSRLPVKSLVRFQSVCKLWRSNLTGNRRFISKHLQRNHNKYVMVKHRRRSPPAVHAIALLSQGTNTSLVTTLPIPFESRFKELRVVGSCNGLVCITDQEYSSNPELPIILWNPSLRKFRLLPRSHFSKISNTMKPHERVSRIVHGFGYHPIIDDYRLVRILHWYDELDVLRIRAEMYSLRTDSWREVESFSHRIYEATCVALNGVLHWIVFGTGSSQDCEFVLWFDLRYEYFGRLELPNINFYRSGVCTKLAELEGKLCLITYTHQGWDKVVQIWVFEYDQSFIWEKILSVGPFVGIGIRPLGCGFSGEIYMEDSNGKLVCYDRNSDEVREIKPVRADMYTFEVHLYVESLVWKDEKRD